ncbi:AGE family epimerase/isomerase [Haloparvum alkalitolerans]|uniref:AGE family epimerase/isomerase n=1 Tax=Haloparvum alkalitolerans TaxID=1042953 RepID=UPI003CE69EED
MTHDDPAALRARALATLRIQYPDTLAVSGMASAGYRLLHPVSGEPYESDRHLVATCRGIANFATGALLDGPAWCGDAAAHGVRFLREGHRADPGDLDAGYRLIVSPDGEPVDRTRSAYAHAFVLLALSRAADAEVEGPDGEPVAAEDVAAAADLLADRFAEPNGLLASDRDAEWGEVEPYRGQNANMHACEAYLAAHRATGDARYLNRARTVAARLTVELAAETDGLLWEHYDADWTHAFGYNADAPRHQFRPPGYQPGHHAEWAKLLALLDRRGAAVPDFDDAVRGATTATDWFERAAELFDAAVDLGWTGDGFAYTVGRDGEVLVPDRYGWAVAEALGAAAALAERARSRGRDAEADRFRDWHRRLLSTADRFRGPAGLWYEKRVPAESAERDDEPVPPEPPGVEPDYHPVGAYAESYRSFRG